MQDQLPNWIFFEFFQKLKKEVDIDLSLEQYQLLLRCLFSKPITSVDELRHLLETIWLTKDKYRLEFERLFHESVQNYILVNTSIPFASSLGESEERNDHLKKKKELDVKEQAEETTSEDDVKKKENQTQQNTVDANSSKPTITNTEKREITININDSEGKQGLIENRNENKTGNFILSDYKYLPFDVRAMEQGWRKMRGKTRFVSTDRIDIKEIVKKRVQQGFIESLIYERKQKGVQKIVWFSDDASSMAPFGFWEEQLFEIMNQVPNTESVERYYFHMYPSEKPGSAGKDDYIFFKNRSHTQVAYLSEILKKTDKNTIFIIYSDAGAAKKNEDNELVRIFFEISKVIRTKSKNLYWINPVKNYNTSSAKFTSLFIPTQYPSNRGINKLLYSQ